MRKAFFLLLLLLGVFISYGLVAQAVQSGQAIGSDAGAAAQPTVGAPTTETSSPDPLLDVPPLPSTRVTLVGGTVDEVDRVRNHLTVQVFGGKRMKMFFDERTHIYRDGTETTQLGIRKGDRVYVDTQLDGARVFARNIRVESTAGPADARGQVLSFDRSRETMALRDELSSEPVSFRINSSTVFRAKGRPASAADVVPGSLVRVKFLPKSTASAIAQDIEITARPGDTFVISGKIIHLDMSTGRMVIRNDLDGSTYEVWFASGTAGVRSATLGAEATVNAEFDGSHYNAHSIAVNQSKVE